MNQPKRTMHEELQALTESPEGITGLVILMAVVLGVVLSLVTGKLPAAWLAGMGVFAAGLLLYSSYQKEPSLQRH